MHSYIVNRRTIPFPILVWGESWAYNFHIPGAVYYTQDTVFYDPPQDQLPATLTSYGFSYSGIPDQGTILGPVNIHILGLADDFTTEVGNYSGSTTAYYRLYHGNVSDEDLLAYTSSFDSTIITSSLTSSLQTTARNVNVQFHENTASSNRIILVPEYLVGQYRTSTNQYMTRIDNPDNSPSNFVDRFPELLTPIYIGYVSYIPFTYNNSSSFDVYLRCFDTLTQVVLSPSLTNVSYSAQLNGWLYTSSISKSGDSILLTASVTQSGFWGGRMSMENISSTSSIVLQLEYALSHSYLIGTAYNSFTTSQQYNPPTLTAFDGQLNYNGSSGYQYDTRNSSDVKYIQYTSGSSFTQFSGSGQLPVSLSAIKNYTISGTLASNISHSDTNTIVEIVQIEYARYLN